MKVKFYYKVGDYEDSAIIEGDSVEDIRVKIINFFEVRGLIFSDCYLYSKILQD